MVSPRFGSAHYAGPPPAHSTCLHGEGGMTATPIHNTPQDILVVEAVKCLAAPAAPAAMNTPLLLPSNQPHIPLRLPPNLQLQSAPSIVTPLCTACSTVHHLHYLKPLPQNHPHTGARTLNRGSAVHRLLHSSLKAGAVAVHEAARRCVERVLCRTQDTTKLIGASSQKCNSGGLQGWHDIAVYGAACRTVERVLCGSGCRQQYIQIGHLHPAAKHRL